MPLTPEEQKNLLADVQTKLTDYGASIENKVKELIGKGLGESDNAVAECKKELEQVHSVMKTMQQQILYIGKGVPGLRESLDRGETKFSVGNLVKALYRMANPVDAPGVDAWKGCESEKEICDAWKKEIATRGTGNYAGDGSEGGYLIPPDVTDPINQIARETNPFESILPVTTLNNCYGQIEIPLITGGTTAYMVGENAEPTASKMTFGKMTANPKRAAALSFVSKTLLFQTQGSIDRIINRDLGEALGEKKHEMCLIGTGNENQPSGLLSAKWAIAASALAGDTNGGRFNITDGIMVRTELEEAKEHKGAPANYAFLMRPVVKAGMATERIKQYTDQAAKRGAPVLQNMGILDDAALASIVGKIATSTFLPATNTKGTSATSMSDVIYGDWSRFWLMNWQGMSIRVSDQAYVNGISAFSQNGMWIIIEEGFNTAIVRPGAFRKVTGAQCNPKLWD
jgi:HK97 family phage major capsid protein